VNGRTLAYLVSSLAGDAEVFATLDPISACESALSPSTKVTFTTPVAITELFPDSPASYFDGRISVSPLPVTVGVPSTISAVLKNPLTVPITVDVSFGFAQSGIGLEFGPIKDIVGKVIPANSSVNLSASWVPVLSGHYCVKVTYAITGVGNASGLGPQDESSGSQQLNFNSQSASMGSANDKAILARADKSWKTVSKIAPRGVKVQVSILSQWWSWAKNVAGISSENLGGDPPRQDYQAPTLPVWHPWPDTVPDANISAARAAAANAASDSLADVVAYGSAAVVALDRYGGASAAQDMIWAAQQANARLYYQQQMGGALLIYADALDAFVQVLVSEGETNVLVTTGDVISYQQSLASQGFTAQEMADARLVGMSDAEIEAFRQEIIAADPNDLAGNVLDFYTNEAAISRELGNALLYPINYAPGLSVSGGHGLLAPAADGNTLAQVNNTSTTLQLRNPLQTTATIDVLARRIDLPADWGVSVSPAQVSLAPGEQVTVTVSLLSGSPLPQGSTPRVAVEGYAGSELLGGVVVGVVVPQYWQVDGLAHIYMPLLEK
jgi:hypothetical protein